MSQPITVSREFQEKMDQLLDPGLPGTPLPSETQVDFNVQVEAEDTPEPTLMVSDLYERVVFQGEGRTLGIPCTFLRLGACNLTCGINLADNPGIWKCDASETWDWTGINGIKYNPRAELTEMSVSDIIRRLKKLDVDALVITGGEPLLQQRRLVFLVRELKDDGWWIEIETNGTKIPLPELDAFVDQYNCSPKLANSGNPRHKRFVVPAIKALVTTDRATFKFVVNDLEDFLEIQEYVDTCGILDEDVYVMPEGITSSEVQKHTQLVAEETVRRRWNLTTRLQILVYESRKSV